MKKMNIKDPEKWKEYIVSRMGSYTIPEECKGGLCIDAGCNIGAFPMAYRERFDKYICFDVFEKNINEAKKNTASIGVDIEFVLKAVWSKSNEKINVLAYNKTDSNELEYFGNSGNIGCKEYICPNGAGWRKENTIGAVETISLEEIINKYGTINLLKIDVEGSEYDFLLDKDLSKINYIVGEFHYAQEEHKELVDHINKTHDLVSKKGNHVYSFKLK